MSSQESVQKPICPSEHQISHIVELALLQRIPPLYLEEIMTRIHQMSAQEAELLIDSLKTLSEAEELYIEKSKRWIAFWKQLEDRIETRMAQELKAIENEIFADLTK